MADAGLLRVRVLARQRVALGTGSEIGYFTGTHSFVPGSVLRGALAATWIAEHGPPVPGGGGGPAAFRELFDGDIRYGPLHAAGSVTVPVSAWLCKYPKDQICKGLAVDAAFEAGSRCPACRGPLEQGKGQVVLPAGTVLDRITRTSIDSRTGKAKEGELYAHAALPAGTILTGYIRGRDPWLEQPRQLRLGGRRTVGGAADYEAEPAEQHLPADPLSDGRLVIRLASPAVFTDAAGRPRLDPDPVLDLGDAAVTIARAWTRPMAWPGWHAASRLPKPEELCAVPGSAYQLTGPPDALRALAARLRRDGAGLRRTEGFGDVDIVTTPWRPAAAEPAADQASASDAETADAAILGWHQRLKDVHLDPDRERWVAGALRALQLELARQGSDLGTAGDLPRELLSRPGAEDFSGRQRELLSDLFAVPDPRVLRDVTTLLIADLPASGQDAE
jgi:CRISPR-associated protein Csx10